MSVPITGKVGVLVLLVFFSNFPMQWVAEYFSLVRPVVNIDYLFVLAFFSFGAWHFGVLFLIIAFVADVLSLVAQVFPFFRFEEIVYISKFLLKSPLVYQLLAIVMVGWLIFLVILHVALAKSSSRLGLLVSLMAFGGCFVASSLVSERSVSYRSPPGYFASSQLEYFTLGRAGAFFERVREGGAVFSEHKEGRAVDLWAQLGFGEPGSQLMLVMAESWGVPKDD